VPFRLSWGSSRRASAWGGQCGTHPSGRCAQEDRTGFVERTPSQNRFFRAGKIGGWREVLDNAQARRVVERHRAQMNRFGYLPSGYKGTREREAGR